MPKLIDHAQRREDIIDVAWDLIVQGGIEAVTMRSVATKAGFANGALRHTFSGKDEIVRATYERAFRNIQTSLNNQLQGVYGLSGLEASMLATLPTRVADQSSARVLLSFWERCAFSPNLSGEYGRHVQMWTDAYFQHLAYARAHGELLTNTPDEQIANEAILLNIGAHVVYVLSPTHANDHTFAAQITDFIARLRAR